MFYKKKVMQIVRKHTVTPELLLRVLVFSTAVYLLAVNKLFPCCTEQWTQNQGVGTKPYYPKILSTKFFLSMI